MDGFRMVSCRTDGMAPSEVISDIRDGALELCPYQKLRPDQADEILDGMLHRGYGRNDNTTPRCLNVLALGRSCSGLPLARIEMNTPAGSSIDTPAVCTYCPAWDSTCAELGADLFEALKDDPEWNADALDDDDDG